MKQFYCFSSFASFLARGQPLKGRICSSRSKFFPLRVDPILKSYLVQRSKQEFLQTDITLFLEKRQGAFIRARRLLGLMYIHTHLHGLTSYIYHQESWEQNCCVFNIPQTAVSESQEVNPDLTKVSAANTDLQELYHLCIKT